MRARARSQRRRLCLALLALALILVPFAAASGALTPSTPSVDLRARADVSIFGARCDDYAGYSVAGAGDVDGDGHPDVVVGAPFADPSAPDASYPCFGYRYRARGAAYVVFGPFKRGRLSLANLGKRGSLIDGRGRLYAGIQVAGLGDVNGDKLDDVAVSSARSTDVVFGSRSRRAVSLARLGGRGFRIRQAGVVAAAGDVNGDGLEDIVVGRAGHGRKRLRAGEAAVIFGKRSSRGVDLRRMGRRGFRIHGPRRGARFGAAVAGAGDVNGDGLDDIVVEAPGAMYRSGLVAGTVYVIFGRTSSRPVQLRRPLGGQGFRIRGVPLFDGRVALADLNGDGLADVIVTTPTIGRPETGIAYVVFGSTKPADVDLRKLGRRGARITGAWPTSRAGASRRGRQAISAPSISLPHRAGAGLAGAGDTNGDGYDDLLVGAKSLQPRRRGRFPQAVYLICGRKRFRSVDLRKRLRCGARLHGMVNLTRGLDLPVAGAGDLNGDGLADVLVGDDQGSAKTGDAAQGTTHIVFGRKRFR